MDAVERVWHKDFNNLHDAIPQEWLVTVEDGSTWIVAEHSNEEIVRRYLAHCTVGYARGWL